MAKHSLVIGVGITLVTSTGVFAAPNQVCKKDNREQRARVFYAETENRLPCKVVVTKSEEEFSKEHITWTGKTYVSFCETKLDSYVSQLTAHGWHCEAGGETASQSGESPSEKPPLTAVDSSEDKPMSPMARDLGSLSNQVCRKASLEIRAQVTYAATENQLPCKVVYKKSEEEFLTDHVLWTGKTNVPFCETKLADYVSRLTERGWQCVGAGSPASTSAEAVSNPSMNKPAETAVMENAVEAKPVLQAPEVRSPTLTEAAPKAPEVKPALPLVPEPQAPPRKPSSESLSASVPGTGSSNIKVEVEPTFDFLRMDGKDSAGNTATVASKNINPEVKLAIGTDWPNGWTTAVSFSGEYLDLQTNSTTDSLAGAKDFVWRTAVGTSHRFTEDLTAGFEAGLSRQLFLYRANATALGLDRLNIVDLTAQGRLRLIHARKSGYGVLANVGFLVPRSDSNLSAHSGVAYRAGFYGEIPEDRFPLLASVYFEQRFQNTSLGDWYTSELGFLVSIGMDLMGGG